MVERIRRGRLSVLISINKEEALNLAGAVSFSDCADGSIGMLLLFGNWRLLEDLQFANARHQSGNISR